MGTTTREELRQLLAQLREMLDERAYATVAGVITKVLELRRCACEGEERTLRARLDDVERQRQALELARRGLERERAELAHARERLAAEQAQWDSRRCQELDLDRRALDADRRAVECERVALAREREALAAAWRDVEAARAVSETLQPLAALARASAPPTSPGAGSRG